MPLECCSVVPRRAEPEAVWEPTSASKGVREEMKELQESIAKHFAKQDLLMEDLSEQVKQCLKRWGREPGIRIKAAGSSLDFGTIERKRESGQSQDEVPRAEPLTPSMDQHRNSARQSFVRHFFTDHMQRARDAALGEFGSPRMHMGIIDAGPSFARWARRLVTLPITSHFIMALILMNLILLGVEVDVTTTLGAQDIPGWYDVVNAVVVIIFVLELVLTLIGFGLHTFFCGPDRWWNTLDFAVVTLSGTEMLVQLWAPGLMEELRYMRFLRLARALRGMRVVELLRYVSALRTLIFSIVSTTSSLFWTLVLLILIFYSFAVILTQIVSDYCRELAIEATSDLNAVPQCPEHVAAFWATVPESILTLYMSISGGVSWIEPLLPLREVSVLAVMFMLGYVVVTVFAVLNVVTGVFCHTAIESATADKEIVVMSRMQKQAQQAKALKDMFREIDADGSGVVSVQELKRALSATKVSSFLESMEISTQDVWTLFMVIDADQNGLIDIDEFVSGCQQLHGPAKSIQMARMSHENKVTRQTIKMLINQIKELSDKVELFWLPEPE